MSRAIAAVLRDAARKRRISPFVTEAVPFTADGTRAFEYLLRYIGAYYYQFTNSERSAFLYLCSLMAEDEE